MAHRLKPETALHVSLCRYLLLRYKGIFIHHSMNEGKREGFQQMLVKMLRVGSGFPDLLLIYRGKCICIELKAEKMLKSGARKQASGTSAKQQAWIDALNSAGIRSAVCVGFDQARKFIEVEYEKGLQEA